MSTEVETVENDEYETICSRMENAIAWLREHRDEVPVRSWVLSSRGGYALVLLGCVYSTDQNWQRAMFAGREAEVGPGLCNNEDRVHVVDEELGVIFCWDERHPVKPVPRETIAVVL